MATSRYGMGTDGIGTAQTGSQSSTGTTSTQGSSSTQQTGGSSSKTTTNQQNIDSKSLQALQQLIADLSGGGTPAMAQQSADRLREIQSVRGQRGDFSKEAAFADAQGAMAQQLRQVMEKLVPSLTRAAEGAGTSQNSMRTLMLQDAATRAAESSSALGLGAASQYGQIGTALSGVLEALTRPNDAASQALLQALNVAKGAVVSGTQNTEASNWSNTNQQASSDQKTQQQTNSSIYKTPTYATTTTPSGTSSGGLSGFRGSEAEEGLAWNTGSSGGSSDDIYSLLANSSDPWASYSGF